MYYNGTNPEEYVRLMKKWYDMTEKGDHDMNITFHIPKDQIIPTDLMLKADDVIVKYYRIEGGFVFDVYTGDREKARDIVQAVIKQMIVDYDKSQHGVTWETVSPNEIQNVTSFGCFSYVWRCKVRDSY